MARCQYRQTPTPSTAVRCASTAGHEGDHDFTGEADPITGDGIVELFVVV